MSLDFKKVPLSGWLGFVALCLVISFLLSVTINYIPQNIEVGMIARRDIKAARHYEIVDQEATEKFRQEALNSLLPVFDFDEGIVAVAHDKLDRAFAHVLSQIELFGFKQRRFNPQLLTAEQAMSLRQGFEMTLETTLSKSEWQALLGHKFSETVLTELKSLAERLLLLPIIASRESLEEFKTGGILLRRVRPVEGKTELPIESHVPDVHTILTLEEAKGRIAKTEKNVSSLPVWAGLAGKLVVPNVNFNAQETDARREEASRNVKNVVIKLQSGEAIIRAGSRYEPWHLKVLEGIQKEQQRGTGPLRFLGTFLFVFLGIGTTFYFSERFIRRFTPQRRDTILMGLTVIVILLVTRGSMSLAGGLRDAFFYNVSQTALYYAIPVAAGSMLIRIYLSAEISLIVAVLSSLLAGLAVGNDVNYTAYCLISAIAGSAVIARADHRSAIMRAGLYTGLANAAAVLGILLIQIASVTKPFTAWGTFVHICFALSGGMFASMLVFVFMPLVEWAFKYTSDIKLLELANLNHPLLKELIIRAPGTYHHSHIIGILGEAAAEAIGANALLVRVGAYYHDIGKIKKPSYYIENLQEGISPHEGLTPQMSALVVQAHVKEGISLAREYGLPQSIIDMIPQHHGTKKISFFYEKAKELEDPEVETVNEEAFRYPGPKPQSREAGILMLADSTEATVRSLQEKSAARIQQTVATVINRSFAEAQLDECDLTLRDLNEIGKAFVRILLGLYHQRIEYPQVESKEEIRVATENTTADHNLPESSGPKSAVQGAAGPDGPPNVRRLKFPDR